MVQRRLLNLYELNLLDLELWWLSSRLKEKVQVLVFVEEKRKRGLNVKFRILSGPVEDLLEFGNDLRRLRSRRILEEGS